VENLHGWGFCFLDYPSRQAIPRIQKQKVFMLRVRRLRVSNPNKSKRSKNSRRSNRRRNVGEVLIVANPRKKRSRNRRRSSAKSRRPNPFRSTKVRRRGHRRSNPSGALGINSKSLLELSLGAAVGMLGSKAAAQAVLGSNNSGWMGLGATAIAGGVLAWGAKKFVGKEAAVGVIAGTGGAIALALWQQYVSGTGSGSMSGLGDPDMAGVLGEYRPGTIPMPSAFNAPIIAAPTPARRRG
jgi:hypothetical protein